MSEVTPIGAGDGSYLGSGAFYRRADGSIKAAVEQMPVHVIEGEQTITARFFLVAQWCLAGVLDLMRQGVRFDEETREAANDGDDA